MIGRRRQARTFALQALYAWDAQGSVPAGEELTRWAHAFAESLDEEGRQFATRLVEAAGQQRARIDDLIATASRNWELARMSRVDRNLLRLGTAELLAFADVPVSVVLNEALELAKQFSTAESPAFVNGVLDKIAQAVGRTRES